MNICEVELSFERIAEALVTCLAFASPAPITSVPSVAKRSLGDPLNLAFSSESVTDNFESWSFCRFEQGLIVVGGVLVTMGVERIFEECDWKSRPVVELVGYIRSLRFKRAPYPSLNMLCKSENAFKLNPTSGASSIKAYPWLSMFGCIQLLIKCLR